MPSVVWRTNRRPIPSFARVSGMPSCCINPPAPTMRVGSVVQLHVAGMAVDFSRREIGGSRFVELVQLAGSGRYLR